jgi:hypothetical protein
MVWVDVNKNFREELCFIRDELALFESWEAYEKYKK